MDPNTLNIIKGAAGAAAGGDPVYVEDVFSTDVYSNAAGAPAPRTVTNGVNFLEEGGLLWVKNRSYQSGGNGRRHVLYSTANSATSSTSTHALSSNTSDDLEDYSSNATLTWKTDGWSVPAGDGDVNGSYFGDYVASSFRKAPGFFDVVTWNGNNGSSKTISHNLGCIPGLIIAKNTSATGYSWAVYAKHGQSGTYNARLLFNSTDARDNSTTTDWSTNSAHFTKDSFTVGSGDLTNMDGESHVAYLFADGADADAQIFGDDGDESIIKCGSYTGDGGNDKVIDLGWEPQYVLLKNTSAGSTNWRVFNNMTGWIAGVSNGADSTSLRPNTNNIESASHKCYITPTGFKFDATEAAVEVNAQASDNDTYIYVAIRRGPMKTPEDATKVFDDVVYNGTGGAHDVPISLSYADFVFYKRRNATDNWGWTSRLQGNLAHLASNGNGAAPGSNAEANRNSADALEYDRQSAFGLVGNSSGEVNYSGESYISYSFKRTPGFFDVVPYNSTNGSTQTVTHNLGVPPELMIFKSRGVTNNWWAYHKDLGASKAIQFDSINMADTSATWLNNTAPTSSVFTLGSGGYANWNTTTYIAYLFASCPGVCSIGSYSGNTGTTIPIDCGFSSPARFVMIKRTNSQAGGNSLTAGQWFVFDSARGINTNANDPLLATNENWVETNNTDYVDQTSNGFSVKAGSVYTNETGGEFIYLAIA